MCISAESTKACWRVKLCVVGDRRKNIYLNNIRIQKGVSGIDWLDEKEARKEKRKKTRRSDKERAKEENSRKLRLEGNKKTRKRKLITQNTKSMESG